MSNPGSSLPRGLKMKKKSESSLDRFHIPERRRTRDAFLNGSDEIAHEHGSYLGAAGVRLRAELVISHAGNQSCVDRPSHPVIGPARYVLRVYVLSHTPLLSLFGRNIDLAGPQLILIDTDIVLVLFASVIDGK